MLQKRVGIVLHVTKLVSGALIVDIYTAEAGRASFFVYLSKSKGSGMRMALFQTLSLIEFEADIKASRSVHQMREAKLFYPFKTIPYDSAKTAIAFYLSEFLYRALKEELENRPLFEYLSHSIQWLDQIETDFANFHIVFLMHLTRYLGLFPNDEDYQEGDYFDLLNGVFCRTRPTHFSFLDPQRSKQFSVLIRMRYDTMHKFGLNRLDRINCLEVIVHYYRLHITDFPVIKSQEILNVLFD